MEDNNKCENNPNKNNNNQDSHLISPPNDSDLSNNEIDNKKDITQKIQTGDSNNKSNNNDLNEKDTNLDKTIQIFLSETREKQEELLEKYDYYLNYKQAINNNNLLYLSVQNDNSDLANLLLMHKMNPNEVNKFKEAPLHISVANCYHKITNLLLENGADPNIQDENGDTSMHIAARKNDYKVIKLLLLYHADKNIENNNKMTPLDVAKERGNKKCIKALSDMPNASTITDNSINADNISDNSGYIGNLNNNNNINYDNINNNNNINVNINDNNNNNMNTNFTTSNLANGMENFREINTLNSNFNNNNINNINNTLSNNNNILNDIGKETNTFSLNNNLDSISNLKSFSLSKQESKLWNIDNEIFSRVKKSKVTFNNMNNNYIYNNTCEDFKITFEAKKNFVEFGEDTSTFKEVPNSNVADDISAIKYTNNNISEIGTISNIVTKMVFVDMNIDLIVFTSKKNDIKKDDENNVNSCTMRNSILRKTLRRENTFKDNQIPKDKFVLEEKDNIDESIVRKLTIGKEKKNVNIENDKLSEPDIDNTNRYLQNLNYENNITESNSDLFEYLQKIHMEKYYENLIKNGFDDIALLIEDIKGIKFLSENDLLKIGIKNYNHRIRILLKLLIDSGYFKENYDFKINIDEKNIFYLNEFDTKIGDDEDDYIHDNISNNKHHNNSIDIESKSNKNSMLDLIDGDNNLKKLYEWLKKIKLENFYIKFYELGYHSVDLLFLQMLSKWPINDEVLKNEFGISKFGYRIRLINKLYNDAYLFYLGTNINNNKIENDNIHQNSGNNEFINNVNSRFNYSKKHSLEMEKIEKNEKKASCNCYIM